MVFTLLETANQHFDNGFITTQATLQEESEAGIGKALYIAIPVVLWGITAQATGGAHRLASRLTVPGNHTTPSGESLLDQVFGKQLGEVTRTVIHHAGIKSIAAYTILAAAAPAVFTTLQQYAREQHMNEASLSFFLASQQSALATTLPAGLPELTVFAELPVTTTIPPAPATSTTLPETTAPIATEEPEADTSSLIEDEEEPEEMPRNNRRRHWLTLAAVSAGALLAWYFFKGNCNSGH